MSAPFLRRHLLEQVLQVAGTDIGVEGTRAGEAQGVFGRGAGCGPDYPGAVRDSRDRRRVRVEPADMRALPELVEHLRQPAGVALAGPAAHSSAVPAGSAPQANARTAQAEAALQGR